MESNDAWKYIQAYISIGKQMWNVELKRIKQEMESAKKACIINVGIGGWYWKGTQRLKRSLLFNGYAFDMLFWEDMLPPGSPTHADDPYAFKVYAFEEAIRQGYTIILWLDSSFWCIKTPHPIFDIICDTGVFAFRTGYNCAQTCSDAALAWAGMTRDQAELLPEIATGAVGINVANPDGKNVYELWKNGCDAGLFKNNRQHDERDSKDIRFLHARQDQSIFSLAIHRLGLKFNYFDYVSYYGTNFDPDKCLFFIGGL